MSRSLKTTRRRRRRITKTIRLLFYLATLKERSPEAACKQVGSAKSLVVATRESCSRRNSDWPRGSGTRSRLRGSGDVSAGQVRYKRADPKPGLSRRDIAIEITVAQPCLDISEKAFQEWLVAGSLAQGRPAIDENESHGPPRKKSPVEKIVSGCFAVGYG
jgi:hypothetical protein